MRDDDGRKLDHATLEALRVRAVKQIEAGEHPEDVARVLGMRRSTVYGWVAKYRGGGLGALKAKPVPGRPSKLEGTQLRRLYGLIVGSDPRQLQFGESAGINRHGGGAGRALRRRGSDPRRPRVMRRWPARAWRSVDRGTCRPGY
jgi:transposase